MEAAPLTLHPSRCNAARVCAALPVTCLIERLLLCLSTHYTSSFTQSLWDSHWPSGWALAHRTRVLHPPTHLNRVTTQHGQRVAGAHAGQAHMC